jgi:hypothetical protein
MSWSGFILYIAPPGRIANWGGWKLMLFTKAEWQALHTIFSYMFFILVIIHLFFVNWKTFLTYLKSRIKTGLNRKWELAAAIIITVLFFIGTLKSWMPFGPVMSFGEKVKESWDNKYESPEVAHMEEYTLKELAVDFPGVSPVELLMTLTDSSINVSGNNETLKSIAESNGITPNRIYEILNRKYKENLVVKTTNNPAGIGRMTLNGIAIRLGKETSELISILEENGVKSNGETTIRAIADQLGISPQDLYHILAEE